MRSNEVEIGKVYAVKVSGKLAPVMILFASPALKAGYAGFNLETKRHIRIRTAARLRWKLARDDMQVQSARVRSERWLEQGREQAATLRGIRD